MKFDEFNHGQEYIVRLKPFSQEHFESAPKSKVELSLKNTDENELIIAWPNLREPVYAKAAKTQDHDILLLRLNRGDPCLATVVRSQPADKPKEITIDVRFLHGSNPFPLMELGVDEKIHEQLKDRLKDPLLPIEDVIRYLNDDFILLPPDDLPDSMHPTSMHRWVIVPSQRAEEYTFNRFRILGAKHAIEVVRKKENNKEILFIEKLTWNPQIVEGNSRERIWLLQGELQFIDASIGARMNRGDFEVLEKIVETSNSYLNLWQSFQDLEIKKLCDSGRSLGSFTYSRCEFDEFKKAWRFSLDASPRQIEALHLKLLEVSDELVLEACSGNVDWEQMFLKKESSHKDGQYRKMFSGSLIKIDLRSLDVWLKVRDEGRSSAPPEEGSIYLSMAGDKVRLNRRQVALARIQSNTAGIKTLGLFLEGRETPYRRIRSNPALSRISKECFRGDPTEKQRKAIDLALNTPDIAIIQGPPGTGKTRTIAAIVQRLNELAKKEGITENRYLLTSFQHDAVDTVAESTVLMGLPAIKFGKKQRQADQSSNQNHVDYWILELIAKVENDLSFDKEKPLSRLLEKVQKHQLAYTSSPGTTEHTADLLRGVASSISGHLSETIVKWCRDEIAILSNRSPVDDFDRSLLRRAIKGLRINEASFSDDGPKSADKLLRFSDMLPFSDADVILLNDASDWDEDSLDTPPFLESLKHLQNRLLDHITEQRTIPVIILTNTRVCDLFDAIISAIKQKIEKSPVEGPAAALEAFVDELRQDPQSGKEAVEHYSTLIAATCQGCSSKKIMDLLDSQHGNDTTFDTVIIDEAARANPLDLLIPMSLARKRIILVGDHRQLPHLLEPDVEKDLLSSVDKEMEKMIRKSLFQKIFESARKLQNDSGVGRSVTLNLQFRMHPELATLVSKSFYEPHGEPYDSPSDPMFKNSFDHGLQGEKSDKRFIWRSIPNSMGGEERQSGGFSWCRKIEAAYIAREAKRLLDEAPALSIGIITFYSAQVNEIMNELQHLQIAVKDAITKSLVVAPNYRNFPLGTRNQHGDQERLRIGTVDAFQGKEFDIVILSPVRSNRIPYSPEASSPSVIRRKFGHLLLANRLCVAMSRQRSLLIVAGDDDMFAIPEISRSSTQATTTHNPVSGLPEFLTMCDSSIGLHTNIDN